MIGLSLALLSSFSMSSRKPRQRVFEHADDVRRAADRIAILQALLVARAADRDAKIVRAAAPPRAAGPDAA